MLQLVGSPVALTAVAGDVIMGKDWNWNVGGVLGYNKNKVTYVNVKAPAIFLQFDYPAAYPRVGVPYNAIYGYLWAGLDLSLIHI